jgi:ABC-2 type transport system ATP-binding protein
MWGVRGLSVRLGSHVAVRDVDLDVPPAEVTAVVGGDGAGKSTLLHALVGLVAPTAGTVWAPPAARIGFQPATSGVWRDLTVTENVEFVTRAYGMSPGLARRRRDDVLGPAGLLDVADRLGGRLSGGMRQKLGFCLAMLHDPELLVLDEPSTGVDPVSRVELWRLVATAAAGGTAVLMSTSYLDEAERAASILVLDRGAALHHGTSDALLRTVPGVVTQLDARPSGPQAERTWRRGAAVRSWWPDPLVATGTPVDLDLEDAVIALTLAHEPAVGQDTGRHRG